MRKWQTKTVFTTLVAATLLIMVYLHSDYKFGNTTVMLSQVREYFQNSKIEARGRRYNITWFKIPFYISQRHDVIRADFKSCEFSNCQMWFGPQHVNHCDAVIFDGRKVKPKHFFKRRPEQIWIFFAHESPISFNDTGAHWTRGGWVSGYNWTMTYDKSNTDIYLPYGEIRRVDKIVNKNYSKIFRIKNTSALIVHSHCHTRSKRESYVKHLQKYVDLDSYGRCGKPWKCGRRYKHDSGNCFERVNGYKFYLAFENALCNQYFTEKMFLNFNYDSIMVVRGGRNKEANSIFPKGTFISTDDFKSIKKLADYMKRLAESEELYTEMLKRKDEYYSVPYKTVYQRAMCELCERMNNQDKYRKQIKSTIQWAFGKEQCEKPTELNLI